MGSIETSDGGSLRVLGLAAYQINLGAASACQFHGRGIQAITAQRLGGPVKDYIRLTFTYDGPAGIDALEFVATLGPVMGVPGNQDGWATVIPISDSQFVVDCYVNQSGDPEVLVNGAVYVAVWAIGGATTAGTVLPNPPS